MKEKRSVSSKNMLGGFLGGVCGILAFGFIHPAFLPLGVLTGVVIGWWYESIFNAIIQNIRKGIDMGHCYRKFLGDCVKNSLRGISKTLIRGISREKNRPILGSAFINQLLAIFIWLFTRPIACWRWLRSHPMNRAYALRSIAFGIQVFVIYCMALGLIHYYMPETLGGIVLYGETTPIRLPSAADYFVPAFFFESPTHHECLWLLC